MGRDEVELAVMRKARAHKSLRKHLAMSDDFSIMIAIWSADAVQSDRAEYAKTYFKFPKEAINARIPSPHYLRQWYLEILANESLRLPRKEKPKGVRFRTLNLREYAALAMLHKDLRKIEDAEAAGVITRAGVSLEITRIAKRDFFWQRGVANAAFIYRSSFIYQFKDASEHFSNKYGINITDFFKFGIILYCHLMRCPCVSHSLDLSPFGIDDATRDAAFKILSTNIVNARSKASTFAASYSSLLYRPSVLRRTPLIEMLDKRGRIHCSPLIDLILERISSGIFYDIVDNGKVLRIVGEKFEAYCRKLIIGYCHDLEAQCEISYAKGQRKTPDVLIMSDGKIEPAYPRHSVKISSRYGIGAVRTAA